MRHDGKVALITGAGSGIGRALASEAFGAGYALVLAGRRGDALEATKAGLANGKPVICIPADLTIPADRTRLLDAVTSHFGRLDLLVNNAGMVPVGALAQTDDAVIERTLRTNLVAPMALTRDALPLFAAAGGGRIVNVGSMFGNIAFPLFAVYSASKFGLRGLSDALRRELRPLGIGVTYAAPRATRTEASPAYDHLTEAFEMRIDEAGPVARQIFRAAMRGRRSIYPRGPERLFTLLQRLVPGLIDRALAKQLARAAVPAGARNAAPPSDIDRRSAASAV